MLLHVVVILIVTVQVSKCKGALIVTAFVEVLNMHKNRFKEVR